MFSLGYNFDLDLIQDIGNLNSQFPKRRIVEFYGAIQMEGIRSARPFARLPKLSFVEFCKHVTEIKKYNLEFNYLLNGIGEENHPFLSEQLEFLKQAKVTAITVATPKLALRLRKSGYDGHLTLSLVARADSHVTLERLSECGINAAYLDAVTINRNFKLLKSLITCAKLELRLYANVSCLSGCPVINSHYKAFREKLPDRTLDRNAAFFRGCSLVKLSNPVEWIQMPWIRPEDTDRYSELGVSQFKLSDRLADSETLALIAGSYLSGRSPRNLFKIIERDGAKFESEPGDDSFLEVRSDKIPRDFLAHFEGGCVSNDPTCPYCKSVASGAILKAKEWQERAKTWSYGDIPRRLVLRAQRANLTESASR